MSRLPRLSGEDVVKVLVSKFVFEVSRQRGSHVILIKHVNGRKVGAVVPLHRELKPDTLVGVLRLAEVEKTNSLKL
ncbi:type II toxin-antitoxin system HicA family toxin [Thermococcus waiotapuensis]|uniref:Type II toxin-antitoxin system HicA family toxin n=1 Tax=Thermococcus waiotapuensis TaxID=90909 RepID=A0AAE4NUW6_9EURY|nr:type II toxin-antitoxin system HicA family toxin [Thermococcus waiotapuensis]MDV3103082.1 type II toxin-antitoxin system HicA family toxin [Thermococcus waiotapuensis]